MEKDFPKPMINEDHGLIVGMGDETADIWNSVGARQGIVLECQTGLYKPGHWSGCWDPKQFTDLPDDHPLAGWPWPVLVKPDEPKKEKDFPKLMISKTNGVILLVFEKHYRAICDTWLAKGVVIESPVAHTKKGEWSDDWVFEYLIDLPDVHPLAKELNSGNAIPESTTWDQQVQLKRMELWSRIMAAAMVSNDRVVIQQSLQFAEAAVNEFDQFFKLKT